MSYKDIKTLIAEGKVMLPAEPPDISTKQVFLVVSESGNPVSLLDTAPMNADVEKSYPALRPVDSFRSIPGEHQTQSSKGSPGSSGSTMAQTYSQSSEAATTDTATQPISKSRSVRKYRYHDGQQLTKNPLKSLSPIHEEEYDGASIKSEPFDVSDDHLEPLTMSLSHQLTYSNHPTNNFDQFHVPGALFTNPLCTPQFYNPEQVHQMFNMSSRPPKQFNSQSLIPQEASYSYMMAPTQPSNLSPTKTTHRHPSYKRLRSSNEDISAGSAIEALLAQPHHFSYNKPNTLTNCSSRSCNKPTKSTDTSTCICPRCGPFSITRYCSSAHLHTDIRRHYIEDCTRRTNMLALIATGTLEPFNKPVRTFVPANNRDNDSLERHRQAVHRSYPRNTQIDYCVFDDADLLLAGEQDDFAPSAVLLARYRGHGEVIATVAMRDNSILKGQFAGMLEKLLAMGVSAGRGAPDKCRSLFNWIKVYFEGEGQWDESMMSRIALAMQLEFGYKVPLKMFESEDQHGG